MTFIGFIKSLPNSLARVTSGGKVIKEVDGLRFIAIFPVVIQHLSERVERNAIRIFEPGNEFEVATYLTNRGFIGVYIFFVISGFILGMPFAAYYLKGEREVSIKSYFIRRITRLEPPYIIVMLLVTLSLVVMGYYSWREILPHFGASIFYMHSLIFHSWSYINPPVWTLEIEVQFYILAPFLALLLFALKQKVMRRIGLISFILILMVLQQYFKIPHQYTILTILAHIHFFLIGFVLVDIYLTEWSGGINKKPVYNYISILSFAAAIGLWSWDHFLVNRILFSLALFLLVYSVFRSTWVNRFITFPWITAIGGMCYTIYLIHLPVIELFIRFSKNIHLTNYFTINFLIQLIILIPILLTLSIIFFLLIEKPCMHKDWPQRLKQYIIVRIRS